MDFGIAGKKAIVLASSQGLGLACASSLVGEGVQVWLNGRNEAKLAAAAAALCAERGVAPTQVNYVVGDLTQASGREAILASCPQPDILITNNAGPPPGKLEDWTEAVWLSALEMNLLGHIQMIRGVVRGMQARKFGRIVNITSAMVKAPRTHQGLSTTARAGLTAFSKALALDVAKDNVTINNILPERIASPRQVDLTERLSKTENISYDEARHKLAQTIAAKRFGTLKEFGDACAFLCSVQASFISGQNLQLDGGSYPGLI